MQKTTRRRFLAAATTLPIFGILPSHASAAEFRLKFATGQAIVARELDKAGNDERADTMALSESPRADLTAKGMQFLEVDKPAFRTALAKTTFYNDWREKFGEKGWGLLKPAVGPLA